MAENRPPLPPFTLETAIQKVRLAEDAWNTRDPQRVALAYSRDSLLPWVLQADRTGVGTAMACTPRETLRARRTWTTDLLANRAGTPVTDRGSPSKTGLPGPTA